MKSLSHLVFLLSCTQHLKNRKNSKPKKSAFEFPIGISALELSARDVHGSETYRTVRCPVRNTSIRTCSNSRIVRTVRTFRTIRTSCLRLLRSTYHGSHRLTRDAWFSYVWPDFLNTSLTRYFK